MEDTEKYISCFSKNYTICNIQLCIFFEKQLYVFFTSADLSHYLMYKSIKVQLSKNE